MWAANGEPLQLPALSLSDRRRMADGALMRPSTKRCWKRDLSVRSKRPEIMHGQDDWDHRPDRHCDLLG